MNEMNTIRGTIRRARSEGLGISENALRRWCKTNQLQHTTVGNRIYVSWSVLLRFLGVSASVDS